MSTSPSLMVGTAEGDLPKLFSLNKGDLSLIFIQRHRLNYFNQTHAHARKRARTRKHVHARAASTRTRMHTRKHAHTRAQARAHARASKHAHMRAQASTQTHIRVLACARICACLQHSVNRRKSPAIMPKRIVGLCPLRRAWWLALPKAICQNCSL